MALTPAEIVAVNRYTHGQELAARERGDNTALQLYSRYAEGIIDAIGELPSRDREHGRAVFETLASSPDVHDRAEVPACLPSLLKVDHDFGLTLFEHLLRDPSGDIRGEAGSLLGEVNAATASGKTHAQAIEWRTELGLTEAEVDHLQYVQLRTERGEGIYRLGEVVLQRLMAENRQASPDQSVTPPDPSPSPS